MFKKLGGYFYSALMKQESRSKNNRCFMIDYDEKEKIEKFIKYLKEDLSLKVFRVVETKKGYHIILEPFNRNEFDKNNWKDADIKIDGNLFVEYFQTIVRK